MDSNNGAAVDSVEPGLRVLEFYSGLGGLHYAAQIALPPTGRVIEAFDINDCANDVYQHNFKKRPYQGNIEALTCQQLDKYAADMWLLSPPCQPYSRQGNKKQSKDARASSFITLLGKLPQLKRPPRYLLLENVVGFETSDTHEDMINTLHEAGYVTQGFILSPHQYGYPYSRPRYFCLAKKDRVFIYTTTSTTSTTSQPQSSTPNPADAPTPDKPPHPVLHDPPYVLLDRINNGPGMLKEVPPLNHYLLKQPCPLTDFILTPPGRLGAGPQEGNGQSSQDTNGTADGATEQQQTQLQQQQKPARTAGKRNRNDSGPGEDHGVDGVQGSAGGDTTLDTAHVDSVQVTGHVSQPETVDVMDDVCVETTGGVDGQQSFETGGPLCADVRVWQAFMVPERLLSQCGDVLDVVTGHSRRQFIKGTGSVVCMAEEYQDPELCTREAVQRRAEGLTQALPHTVHDDQERGGGDSNADVIQHSSWELGTSNSLGRQGVVDVSNGADDDVHATRQRSVGHEDEQDGTGGIGGGGHPLMPKLNKGLMAAEWKHMSLRFASPREVALLHALPPSFSFPPQTTLKQRYQLLGNSLNVSVVADLIHYLLMHPLPDS